ncbi:MAG: hypothetical protein ACRDK3_08595 [Actinomycetota bacterium]
MTWLKVAGVALTITLLTGAALVGGGRLPMLAEIADRAEDAARNARIAERNTAEAVRSTEALAEIARDVQAQVRASTRLLETQLRIEESARASTSRSSALAARVARIRDALKSLEDDLLGLSALSARAGGQADITSNAALNLRDNLEELVARFAVVTRESRELNQKSEGFGEIRDLLP